VTNHSDHANLFYGAVASLAGAVTALSFLPWKTMRWAEIAMTLFVGSAFATFCVPYLAGRIGNVDLNELRALCFFTYVGATGANVFLPIIIRAGKRWLEKVFGTEDAA
jgi:hypothetical protein